MTTIHDSELHIYADRLKGAVVVITGASNGIGKAAALDFAKYGAKVVIGDLDQDGAQKVVNEIKSQGGNAACSKTDVLSYDSLIKLFQLAINEFGKVDIVVPCAGLTELGEFGNVRLEQVNGVDVPKKPNLKTLEVNLIGVMYTTHLALHYMTLDRKGSQSKADAPKTIVFIGSIASITGLAKAPNYSAAKHGIVGFMGGLSLELKERGIRAGVICPFFAETQIVPIPLKIALAGIPKVPIARIAGTIIRCATDTDPTTNESLWTLPDGEPLFRIGKEDLNQGVYKMLNDRLQAVVIYVNNSQYWVATLKDLVKLAAGKKVILGLVGVAGVIAARRQGLLGS